MPGDLPGGPPPDVGGGGLSKKLWGLPTWGWIAIAAAGGIVLYIWLQSRKGTASSTTTPATDGNVPSDGASSDLIQTLQSQIRDLQGQVSTPVGDTPTTTPSTQLPAPTNLKFGSVTTTHGVVTWTPVSGAVSYVCIWQTKAGTARNVPFAPINDHSYKLKKGDTVNVKVTAVAPDGTEGQPAVVSTQIK